jgi:hypothetical protein
MRSSIYLLVENTPIHKDFYYVKIGFSNNPLERLKAVDVGPQKIDIISEYEGETRTYIKNLEKKLHAMFSEHQYRNEWFKLMKDQIKTIDDYLCNFCKVYPHYYNKEYLVMTDEDCRVFPDQYYNLLNNQTVIN